MIQGRDRFSLPPVAAALLFGVALAASLVPILDRDILSLGDFENHLVRGWVLLHYADRPEFAHYFAPNWQVFPNLAIDLHVFLVGRFLPLAATGDLFVALTFAALLGGCLLLHRAVFRRWSLWPFAGALLLFNRLLIYGLLNYLFAGGLYLIAVALWIVLRRRGGWARVGALAVPALLIFLSHFFAFGLLGLTILAYEAASLATGATAWRRAAGNLVVAGAALLPALVLLAVFAPRADQLGGIAYHSLADRLGAFAAPILYDAPADMVGLALVAATVAALAAAGALRFDRELAIVCLVLVLAQLAMPDRLVTAQGADHRIPLLLGMLAICATDAATPSRRLAGAFAGALVIVGAARLWEVESWWRGDDAIYAEVRPVLAALPAGAKVATAYPAGTFDHVTMRAIAMYYLPVWDLIPRGGFTQTLYTIPTQHPLIMQPAYRELAHDTQPTEVWDALTSAGTRPPRDSTCRVLRALQSYDDVIVFGQTQPPPASAAFLTPLSTGAHARLYRVAAIPVACGTQGSGS